MSQNLTELVSSSPFENSLSKLMLPISLFLLYVAWITLPGANHTASFVGPPTLNQEGDVPAATMLLSVLALSRSESTPESMGEDTVQSISK